MDDSTDVVGDILRRYIARKPPREPAVTCLNCDGSGVIHRAVSGAVYEWTCPCCLGLGSLPGARPKKKEQA